MMASQLQTTDILCWRISKEIKGTQKKKQKLSCLPFGGEKETRARKATEGQRDLDAYLMQSIQHAKMPCTGTWRLSPNSHSRQDMSPAHVVNTLSLREFTNLCSLLRCWQELPFSLCSRGPCLDTRMVLALVLGQRLGTWLESPPVRACLLHLLFHRCGAFSHLSFCLVTWQQTALSFSQLGTVSMSEVLLPFLHPLLSENEEIVRRSPKGWDKRKNFKIP